MIKILKHIVPHGFLRRLRALALRGQNVYCPCCKGQYLTFLPFGVIKRPNAQCPGCHSLERHRLLCLYLEQKTDLFKGTKKLLHIAPESVFFKRFQKNGQIDYFPVDKFEKGYSYPKGTLNQDITHLDFSENTFDVILCSHVLEHIPDDHLAMKELYRVLKPGGWAILQVPLDTSRATTFEDFSVTDPKERERLFGQFDHVRVYGNDYKDRLKAAGFEVTVDSFIQSFSKSERFRWGLSIEEDIYLCRK